MARLAIRMPKMSMTMTEGEVSTWFASVGDEVAVGDVVCEVMTDKVDMEVESTVAGTLVEIAVESGTVAVGEPIGWLEGEDEGGSFGDLLAEPPPAPAEEIPATTDPEAPASTLPAPESGADAGAAGRPAPAGPRGPVAAVPRARGLALEHGLDLATVTGTGPDGLVLVADVEQVLGAAGAPPAPPTAPARPAPAAARPAPAPQPAARPPGKAPAPTRDRRAAVRAVVARTMEPSALIPQFTCWREIELDAADAGRRGISWTTVLLRGYAAALREVPDLLSRWEGGRAVDAGPPAVALAVATDRGLMVPVFTEPDRADPRELDREMREVVAAAHAGRLAPAYLGTANASLSNLGGLGVDRFQALLTPPQASVLSLGSIRRRPVAVPGGVGLALTVHAGLTVDHRTADGAHAADVLARLARLLSGGV